MSKRKGEYKAGPGRPKGSGSSEFPIKKTVRINQKQLDHLLSKYKDASDGIRALIDADIARCGDEGKLEDEVSQKQ